MIDKNIAKPTRLIYNNPVSLVTVNYKDRKNIFTVSWLCAASNNPPLVIISVGKDRYSRPLIEKSGMFVINIPNAEMIKDVMYCGNVSGKDNDKLKERNLRYTINKRGGIILDDAIAYLECEVRQKVDAGDHIIFLGEVTESGADSVAFANDKWNVKSKKANVLSYLGDGCYTTHREL